MKIAISHPTGNQNVRAVVQSLANAEMLAEFITTISVNPDNKWTNLLPDGMRNELLRRSYHLNGNQIKTYPVLEIARLVFSKLGLNSIVSKEAGWAGIDAVYKGLDIDFSKRLEFLTEKQKIDAVYAYEDGALATFIKAKELGLKCIYDLPIAYWETGRKLMKEEAERLPNWAQTLGGGITDSEAKLKRKTRELELADVVIGPGSFVLNSLPAWARDKKIIMTPFGSPTIRKEHNGINKKTTNGPLRVLFVGSLTQRKGLADLFEAVRLLNTTHLELVVMGSPISSMDFYRKELSSFVYEPGRPNSKVLDLMSTCDIFCLPSIVEGRALVMQEAMSQGLPLIITPNTGGEDLIIEGETGFLIPIRSPQAIAEKLSWFLEHKEQIQTMGIKARKHAASYTWENYGKNIVDTVTEYLK